MGVTQLKLTELKLLLADLFIIAVRVTDAPGYDAIQSVHLLSLPLRGLNANPTFAILGGLVHTIHDRYAT